MAHYACRAAGACGRPAIMTHLERRGMMTAAAMAVLGAGVLIGWLAGLL